MAQSGREILTNRELPRIGLDYFRSRTENDKEFLLRQTRESEHIERGYMNIFNSYSESGVVKFSRICILVSIWESYVRRLPFFDLK